jgi:DNA-binding SARP family transcriptional activator
VSEQQLRYSVLGPVRAWLGGVELRLGPPRQRAVLAMLLLNANRVVTLDAIADGVWGEAIPVTAVNVVHTYISRLRRILEPGRRQRETAHVLARAPSGYVLRADPGQLDLDEFHDLIRRARACRAAGDPAGAADAYTATLALWVAPALAGIPGPAAENERTRLAELRLTVLEEWAETLLEFGGHHRLSSELLALAAEYPLRERIQALLMTALYQSGRQAEALMVYTRTRTLLADELGIDPGPELQRLHLQILTGDAVLAASKGESLQPEPSVPHQLPTDIPHFAGRAEQLRQITTSLEAASERGEKVAIAAIDGMGGVGKSVLAIHAAHQLTRAGRFPHGQLYLNLHGATPGLDPLEPLDAIGYLLRALGVEAARIPTQLDEAAAMFRTLTAERRLLVVLDNARDAGQVRPLIPASPACAVLVTSRQILATLDLTDAQPSHLDVLPENEALTLLARLVDSKCVHAEPESCAQMVRWCGYLPLAIRIAAARLTARPSWRVCELVDRLAAADATYRLEELRAGELGVQASFDVSLQALQHSPDPADQAAAKAFGLLSLPDGPDLDVMAAAALLDQPKRATQTLLERLVDAQLLQTPQPGRYQFHDLVRLHARQCAIQGLWTEAEQTAAIIRLLTFYTASASDTLALLRPGDHRLRSGASQGISGLQRFPDAEAALVWLEGERPNLLAAIAQTAATPAIPNELAFRLTSALYGFFVTHGHWADGVRANQMTLDLARRNGDRAAQAQAHCDLGAFYWWLGRYEQALSHHRQSLTLARELGDFRCQATSLSGLGNDCVRLGRYQDAIGHYQESLALARDRRDIRGQGAALGNLGNIYHLIGRYSESLACHQDSVILFRQLGDRRGQAGSLTSLGKGYEKLGLYREAVTCQRDSLRLFCELEDRSGEALALNNLGRVYQKLGRYAEGLACQRDSLRLFRELGGRHGQAEALRDLGDALLANGQPCQARGAWQEALEIIQALNVPDADLIRCRLATGCDATGGQSAVGQVSETQDCSQSQPGDQGQV